MAISNRDTLSYSTLEPRQVLTSITLVDGNLRIVGTSGDDRVEVYNDIASDFLRVSDLANDTVEEFAKPDVKRIEFWGLAGNDEMEFLEESNAPSGIEVEYVGFYGGGGNDRLFVGVAWGIEDFIGIGGAGDDVLEARAEVDRSSNAVKFYGGDGFDRLQGGFGHDVLVGQRGNDQIFGSVGNDLILGGDGDDRLDGGAGSDEVLGGADDDVIYGGEDTLVSSATPDFDSVIVPDVDDRLVGGTGHDAIIGGSAYDLILGGEGNDNIFGSAEFTGYLIYAGPGDDFIDLVRSTVSHEIFGQQGNDRLVGGTADDLIYAGPGDDVVYGLEGNDRIFGEAGHDELFGGDGNDIVFGNEGDDIINGFTGDDRLFGGIGNDTIVGGDGNDLLNAFSGNDVLLGQGGNDRFVPHAGLNYMHGGDGDDFFLAGGFRNRIIGGPGIDTFFESLDHSIDYVLNDDIFYPDVRLADFLGLTEMQAIDKTKSLGRQWCIFRVGDPVEGKGDQFVEGRLSFTIDNGLVVRVQTESGVVASTS